MMSHCIVPDWNLNHQQIQQVQAAAEEEANTSSHLNNNNMSSNCDVAELTWENGQVAMHGLGVGGALVTPTKPTWDRRTNDTLESIVHQATKITCRNNNNTNMVESSDQVPGLPKKRPRPADSDQCGRNFASNKTEEKGERSAFAIATATFCRDNNDYTTKMTRASSYESPNNKSLKIETTYDDSGCHGRLENQDDDHETKTGRSHSSRRSRDAAIHNQSERRRRDRINQKMKELQRLVPNASKTDKASMLDEVIDYLKQLQSQVQMMSVDMRNNMHQMNMMMPLGLQQQLQMSLLAPMGMGVGLGMGMGMFDMNTVAAAAARSGPQLSLNPLIHPTVPPVSPFLVPSMLAAASPPCQAHADHTKASSSVNLPDPYSAFLAQSMNMELYNKMAAIFRQQVNQNTQQATCNPSMQSNDVQED